MNQRSQTLTNDQILKNEIENHQVVNQRRLLAEDNEREARYSSGFPKPVMVYENPNFKPYQKPTNQTPKETRMVRQVARKGKASEPAMQPGVLKAPYRPSPALFLNKDTGSSFADPERITYYDPETGQQYGEIPHSRGQIPNSLSNHTAFETPNGKAARQAELEKAKYILRKNASENLIAAAYRGNLAAVRANQDPRAARPAFQRGAGDVAQGRQGSRPGTVSHVHLPQTLPPKRLYKISSAQAIPARLVRQPAKQHVMTGYSQALVKSRLDTKVNLDQYLPPPPESETPVPYHDASIPDWSKISRGEVDFNTVFSYVQTPVTGEPGRVAADPGDIDD